MVSCIRTKSKERYAIGHWPILICHLKTQRQQLLILLLCFIGVGLLLFGLFLRRLFFRDGFFALVGRRRRSLGRLDQLLGGFSVLPGRLHREKLFQNRNRVGNRVGLTKVRNSELI